MMSSSALPEILPIFPLPGVLLLPRGQLPLNIFEPRYIAMVNDALKTDRLIGMIQPRNANEDMAKKPELVGIGCAGRIVEYSETDDGRFLITLVGISRFTIAEELPNRRGYRWVRADFSAFASDLDPTPQPNGVEREALLSALRAYFTGQRIDANWDAIQRIPDDQLIVTLAGACPFEPAEKQLLLEAATEADRAATLMALLQMGASSIELPPNRNLS